MLTASHLDSPSYSSRISAFFLTSSQSDWTGASWSAKAGWDIRTFRWAVMVKEKSTHLELEKVSLVPLPAG